MSILATALCLIPHLQDPVTPQATPPAAVEPAYPAVRPKSHVLFFSLEGDLKAEPMQKALSLLSTPQAECKLVAGPESTAARNGKHFVAVEAPVQVTLKDLSAALKKGCGGLSPLAVSCFQGDAMDQGGMRGAGAGMPGFTARDFVVGMDADLRWYENIFGFRQFFYTGKRLDAERIAERYKKLMSGFGGNGDVGKSIEEELSWSLTTPLDPAVAKRAEKALSKLDGVRSASIDSSSGRLTMRFALEGLGSSGPLQLAAGLERLAQELQIPAEQTRRAARVRYDTWPIFEVLDKEALSLAAK